MKFYWVYANIDGRARWHLVMDKDPGLLFVEADFEEEYYDIKTYQEENPSRKVIGPINSPCSNPKDGAKICQRCGSERVAEICAKCSDLCSTSIGVLDCDGYAPQDMGLENDYGDYVHFSYCLDCGQIQGKWPIKKCDLEKGVRHNQEEDADEQE